MAAERIYAVVGDVHAHMEHLEQVCAAVAPLGPEAVLLVGDIGSHELGYQRRRTAEKDARYLASFERVLERVRALGAPVLWVPGNHDLPRLPDTPAFAGNIDGRVVELDGVRIAGFGGAGPGFFGFPYEWSDEQARRRGLPDCDLVLAHAPPAGTRLDLLHDGRRHVGSAFLRERLRDHAGAFACGHIHEAGGAQLVERAVCVNAGGLGPPFAKAQYALLRLAGGRWSGEFVDLAAGRRERADGP